MTRIDFYILPDSQGEARDHYACQLTEQAYRQGQRVLIHCADEAHGQRLDALLWCYRDSSFIPHAIQGAAGSATPPAVEIGHGGDAGGQHQLLINLAPEIPEFFSRFDQVSEIVVAQDSAKALSREHYRYYQDHGYRLEHHRIRQRILSQ
jgi:DNA polymerase-3 subunit chi